MISMHCKGMSQAEIASALGVNQSTVSRDLRQIRKRAVGTIEDFVVKGAPFEYYRCICAIDEIAKRAWELAENRETTTREKLAALSLLMDCCHKRLGALFGKNDGGLDNAFEYVLNQDCLKKLKMYESYHQKGTSSQE